MVFKLEKAVEVRNHYKDILIGQPLSEKSGFVIDGILICHEGNINKAIEILARVDFDDKYPLIGVGEGSDPNFQIFVYGYDNSVLIYNELDDNLTKRGMAKIYE